MRRRALLAVAAIGVARQAGAAAAPWTEVMGDAGYGAPALSTQQGDLLLLRHGPGGNVVVLHKPWDDGDGDRPQRSQQQAIEIATAALGANDPLVPVRDGPFWRDPARWLLWREGAVVHAVDTTLRRQSLQLPMSPAALLRPALQRSGGPVEVFALAANRRSLRRLCFGRTAGNPSRLFEEVSLPLPAGAGSAALTSAGGIACGLWSDHAEGTTLMVHEGTALRHSELRGLHPLSAPAMLAGPDGLRIGLIVRQGDALSLSETLFPQRAGDAVTRLMPLGPATTALGATLVYRGWDGMPPAVHAVLSLADGRFLRLQSGGIWAPFEPPAPPLRPLVLVPGVRAAWLLCCDPASGPLMTEV
ncbi:MAG: hypothetical protein Q8M01_22965 [Rubrivivax sp.]|nr:hypothetical protein [Rubrivivax sp.]